ncbi:hypothetical protein MKY59_21330 [Paenibacillus sp. FSL W8-0426]|uniref:hypothetical protein n=1 Tax=Paenibacillus sp. FSL W8-0426 TaxID=2921714 RepID=UPI0030D9E5F8
MADITTEILAIEAFIKSVIPAARVEKQTVPLQPSAGLFVVRFLTQTPATETLYHYRMDRDYQVLYYSAKPQDAFPVMDALSNALYDEQRIASSDSRLDSFTYAMPTKSSTDKASTTNADYVTPGILRVTSRRSRPQPTYPLINSVNSRFT